MADVGLRLGRVAQARGVSGFLAGEKKCDRDIIIRIMFPSCMGYVYTGASKEF